MNFGCDVVAPPPLCIDGDARLAENYTYESTYTDEIYGYLEICTNNNFIPVCYNESFFHAANLSCQQLGYDS